MRKEVIREVKLEWNYRILAISTILTIVVSVFPILSMYGINLTAVSVIVATVSIVNNLVLVYSVRQKNVVKEIIWHLG